jgi:hypothetical protein
LIYNEILKIHDMNLLIEGLKDCHDWQLWLLQDRIIIGNSRKKTR